MSITLEGLSASKSIQVWFEGKLVPCHEHYFVCMANDLGDVPGFSLDRRAEARRQNLLKGRITRLDRYWEKHQTPPLSYYKVEDGANVSAWREGVGSMYDCDMKSAGVLRRVEDRLGNLNWVVFPHPKCHWCEDTGIVVHTISQMASKHDTQPCIAAEKGDRCPNCGDAEARAAGEAKWRVAEAARDARAEAAALKRLSIQSLNSCGL